GGACPLDVRRGARSRRRVCPRLVARARPAPPAADAAAHVPEAGDGLMTRSHKEPLTTPGKISVGVVGVGYWGPNLVRNLAESSTFDLTHVCDSRPEMLEAVARRYPGVKCTTRYEDLLRADLEAVAIATPVSTHHALAMSALQAGKHAFVEKPLAASTEQVVELMTLAEQNGLVLMPGHTFLYSPPVTTIKSIIDSGELGDIYFISSSRVNLGLHQRDVSVVWDLGPHDFSILLYWLSEMPTSVRAVVRDSVVPGIADVAFVTLTFGSGIVANVELSWLAPSK